MARLEAPALARRGCRVRHRTQPARIAILLRGEASWGEQRRGDSGRERQKRIKIMRETDKTSPQTCKFVICVKIKFPLVKAGFTCCG